MNKIFFVLPYLITYSFVCASEQPKKPDISPLRDGVRRKMSNPVARVQVDQQFDSFMTKNESRSPRKTYEAISADKKNKEMDEMRKRRSGSVDQK